MLARMALNYDTTEFVDTDFQTQKTSSTYASPGYGAALASRAPTREEVESKVTETQQKLVELKRAQEKLERERAMLEETRRRQMEFTAGRQEMIQSLTRGVGLLEKAEFDARLSAEQMGRVLAEFRSALTSLESIHDETWSKDNFATELTRALTVIENARMEWNSARLKISVLSGQTAESVTTGTGPTAAPSLFEGRSLGELCKIGFALTWLPATVAFLALGLMVFLVLRH